MFLSWKSVFVFFCQKMEFVWAWKVVWNILLKLSEIQSFLNFSRELSLSSRCFATDHQLWKWVAKQGNYHSSQPYLYQKAKAVTLKKCQLTCTVGNLRGFFLPGKFFFCGKISICVAVRVWVPTWAKPRMWCWKSCCLWSALEGTKAQLCSQTGEFSRANTHKSRHEILHVSDQAAGVLWVLQKNTGLMWSSVMVKICGISATCPLHPSRILLKSAHNRFFPSFQLLGISCVQ